VLGLVGSENDTKHGKRVTSVSSSVYSCSENDSAGLRHLAMRQTWEKEEGMIPNEPRCGKGYLPG